MSNNIFGIYCRTACKDSSNIQKQITLLKEYLSNHNLTQVAEFIDNGYSGLDMNRPGLNQLIKAIENKKIDGIIVEDISRLGRDKDQTMDFFNNYCKKHQIRFISVNNDLDIIRNYNFEKA